MSQSTSKQEQTYVSLFEQFDQCKEAVSPKWLQKLRKEAITRFAEIGFPVARQGNERWKYTNVNPIAQTPFEHGPTPGPETLEAHELSLINFWASHQSQVVFINGRFSPHSTSVSALPKGVTVTNLGQATPNQLRIAKNHFAQYADYHTNGFTALNTAFVSDAALIAIPDATTVKQPIHLLFVSKSLNNQAIHPRTLIVVGKNSNATIVVTHLGLNNSLSLTNSVTEIMVSEEASVDFYRLQREGNSTFHIGTTQVSQKADSTFNSLSIDLGGKLVRHDLNILMEESGSKCNLNGLYVLVNDQHVDNQTFVDHAQPHTTSQQYYKGVVSGHSKTVFNGRVLVRKDAQGTDAQQSNKTLTLSDHAKVASKPQLEIYADDVKCNHGSAIGQLDASGLFYLKARGLDDKAARTLLALGFMNEILSSVTEWHLRTHTEELINAKLHSLFG